MPKFTVFCQELGAGGTIWIGNLEAPDANDAATMGAAECADDWGYEVEHVHVLGVAKGDVEIVLWEDQDDD